MGVYYSRFIYLHYSPSPKRNKRHQHKLGVRKLLKVSALFFALEETKRWITRFGQNEVSRLDKTWLRHQVHGRMENLFYFILFYYYFTLRALKLTDEFQWHLLAGMRYSSNFLSNFLFLSTFLKEQDKRGRNKII